MRLLISVFLLMPLLAVAETAYVTDNLRLGLHAAEDTSDRAFRFLESGQPMEILVRDRNYANVRLPDGTEGWVKSAYLVDEKPAKLIVAETVFTTCAVVWRLARSMSSRVMTCTGSPVSPAIAGMWVPVTVILSK